MNRTCSRCQETKPLTEFSKNSTCTGGYTRQCYACNTLCVRAWQLRNKEAEVARKAKQRNDRFAKDPQGETAKFLTSAARHRAIRFKKPFDLNIEWVRQQIDVGRCSVTALPFVYERHGPFVPSIDQIEPGRGYTKENSQIVVWIYNAAKQNWGHEAVLVLAKSLSDIGI